MIANALFWAVVSEQVQNDKMDDERRLTKSDPETKFFTAIFIKNNHIKYVINFEKTFRPKR